MICVTAPSRLHFGLLRLPSAAGELTFDGNSAVFARQFGGVGLMIDKPGLKVTLAPARAWFAAGPCGTRALKFAQVFLQNSPELEASSFAVAVKHCAPEHVGLGTGTQLGLAVAKALAVALGRPDWDAAALARRIGRGQRSAIGVHGFHRGGFLVDGGKGAGTTLAPLVAHHVFPAEWSVLVVLPKELQGLHGRHEQDAFAHLAKNAAVAQPVDALCRLVLLGILPALVERDLPAFGEALYEFNRRVGEVFKPWQGGIYANAQTAALVDFLRKNGAHGVGQSSWGPAVFAIDTAERVNVVAELLRNEPLASTNELIVCRAHTQTEQER